MLKHKSENAGGKLLVHKELKQYKSLWITEFQHCGVDGHAIQDSLNAARSSGNVEALADPMTREGYSISTAGLLCSMWFWHRCSRTMAGRERAGALLEGFVARACGAVAAQREALLVACREDAHRCRPDCGDGDLCRHCNEAMGKVMLNNGGWASLIRGLTFLRVCSSVCPAAKSAIVVFLTGLVALINGRAAQDDESLGLKDDLRHRPLMCTPRKRMRIDEDYKHHTAVEVQQQRAAPNAARVIRGEGLGCTEANGRHWEAQVCSKHQLACEHAFEASRVCHLAEDGSRLGNPAEETIIYLAWSADLNIAGVPPPQALRSALSLLALRERYFGNARSAGMSLISQACQLADGFVDNMCGILRTQRRPAGQLGASRIAQGQEILASEWIWLPVPDAKPEK